MVNGNACFAYFNKIWGIPLAGFSTSFLKWPAMHIFLQDEKRNVR